MKNKIFCFLFILFLSCGLVLGILISDEKISLSERRKLASFPTFEWTSLLDGTYFEEIDTYLVEQFPYREYFRRLKSWISTNFFFRQEENGVFIEKDGIYELNPTLNEKSVLNLTNLMKKVTTTHFSNSNIYYSIIPDKNYYLKKRIPKLDYEKLTKMMNQELTDFTYIPIFENLSLDSYYKTDIHWKQESIANVTKTLLSTMTSYNTNFLLEEKTNYSFYGSLASRISNHLPADTITYLTNPDIINSKVYDYENQIYRDIYEESDLSSLDKYDIFLGGAKPLLIIEKENKTTNRELILFRDSFGSSITPLLLSSYDKITLIDFRYFNSSLLETINDFLPDSDMVDVLFLYSVPIINNSFTLK